MAVVTSDLLNLVKAGCKVEFDSAYQARRDASVIPSIATVIPTTLPTQNYDWLSSNPKMRAFNDERVTKALKAYDWSITDQTWEATLEVDRRALEDDQYGLIYRRARGLGEEPVRHMEEKTVVQYALGFTVNGPDATTFFSTSHAESGTNQSNRATAALSDTALKAAIAAMIGFTDDAGKPLGITPTTLVVGPANMFLARTLLQSTINVATGVGASAALLGNANTLQGMLNLVVSPYLVGTYANYWFVLDTSRAIGGVILQERSDVPIEFAALDNPNSSEPMFMRDKILYGVRARYQTGFGLWQTAYGSIQ